MSSCEKCWADSRGDTDRYSELLKERKCTPEEQAGEFAAECPSCNRKTLHQYTKQAMCGCDAASSRTSQEKP